MNGLTLKQLRYFEALAEHGHFGRAADACAVTQPALSMQIKELEDGLGTALFERSARQVRLTSLGTEFLSRVRDILRAVDELDAMARARCDGIGGQVRLGIIPTIAPYLLPRIVADLEQTEKDLKLRVREALTSKLIEALSDGRIDAAIVALPVSEPAFTEVPLFTESFVLVRPPADEGKPVPAPDELREMQLLLLEEGHCFRDQALSFCNMPTVRHRDFLDASSLSTLVQMVGAGLGVTLLPEMALGVETRSAQISVARFRAPEPTRQIGMIWRKTSPIADQLMALADLIREAGMSSLPKD